MLGFKDIFNFHSLTTFYYLLRAKDKHILVGYFTGGPQLYFVHYVIYKLKPFDTKQGLRDGC